MALRKFYDVANASTTVMQLVDCTFFGSEIVIGVSLCNNQVTVWQDVYVVHYLWAH